MWPEKQQRGPPKNQRRVCMSPGVARPGRELAYYVQIALNDMRTVEEGGQDRTAADPREWGERVNVYIMGALKATRSTV